MSPLQNSEYTPVKSLKRSVVDLRSCDMILVDFSHTLNVQYVEANIRTQNRSAARVIGNTGILELS